MWIFGLLALTLVYSGWQGARREARHRERAATMLRQTSAIWQESQNTRRG